MTNNPPQAPDDKLASESRLTALEIKASFLEDTVDQLDSALARQQL